ncbi:hypothetical protein [Microbacterium luteum]|uniref:hypothetical protein n=1 Tax=Microbacterium luteum TaxID=2782167 RepID=UPI001886F341|nr:hypothetical protein [Microbacterium luteum]
MTDARRRIVKTPIPTPFIVTREMWAWAEAEGYPLPFVHQTTEAFVAWHRERASKRSSHRVEWAGAWRNWVRRAWAPRPLNPPGGQR